MNAFMSIHIINKFICEEFVSWIVCSSKITLACQRADSQLHIRITVAVYRDSHLVRPEKSQAETTTQLSVSDWWCNRLGPRQNTACPALTMALSKHARHGSKQTYNTFRFFITVDSEIPGRLFTPSWPRIQQMTNELIAIAFYFASWNKNSTCEISEHHTTAGPIQDQLWSDFGLSASVWFEGEHFLIYGTE